MLLQQKANRERERGRKEKERRNGRRKERKRERERERERECCLKRKFSSYFFRTEDNVENFSWPVIEITS